MQSLGRVVRFAYRTITGGSQGDSSEHQLVEGVDPKDINLNGWLQEDVASRQHEKFRKLLDRMYQGDIRPDLKVGAEAVESTGSSIPEVLEIGCGSGYYSEIFSYLIDGPLEYVGCDYSPAMIQRAMKHYPDIPFFLADATSLPIAPDTVEIVMNGNALIHIGDYEAAIAESARIAKEWCIFHTVPVLDKQKTTVLTKKAYGGATVEVLFNERELLEIFNQNGLHSCRVLSVGKYGAGVSLDGNVELKTYVLAKV